MEGRSKAPQCPFYERHRRRGACEATVTCESFFKNSGFGERMQLAFPSFDDQKAYMEMFCRDTYWECPVYQFISTYKYGG